MKGPAADGVDAELRQVLLAGLVVGAHEVGRAPESRQRRARGGSEEQRQSGAPGAERPEPERR